MPAPLRFLTYLSPSIPFEFFEAAGRHVERKLRRCVHVAAEVRFSGPPRGRPDPFGSGEVDVGFLCSPTLFWMQETTPAPAELLGVAAIFADPRATDRARYWSDVVVRTGSRFERFEDLRGGTWAYNDVCSLSGFYSLLQRLAETGEGPGFLRRLVDAGSHLRSIELVTAGEVDAAAIDSNALAMLRRRRPDVDERLRVLESWGPFPAQPVVVRAGLDPALRRDLATALLDMGPIGPPISFERFVPIGEDEYADERRALESCERAFGPLDPARLLEHPHRSRRCSATS